MTDRTTKTQPGDHGLTQTISEQERPDGHVVTHKFGWPTDDLASRNYEKALEQHNQTMDFLVGLPASELLARQYKHCVKAPVPPPTPPLSSEPVPEPTPPLAKGRKS